MQKIQYISIHVTYEFYRSEFALCFFFKFQKKIMLPFFIYFYTYPPAWLSTFSDMFITSMPKNSKTVLKTLDIRICGILRNISTQLEDFTQFCMFFSGFQSICVVCCYLHTQAWLDLPFVFNLLAVVMAWALKVPLLSR